MKDHIWRVQFGRSVRKVCSVRPQRIARHLLCKCQLSMTVRVVPRKEEEDAQVNETDSVTSSRESDNKQNVQK